MKKLLAILSFGALAFAGCNNELDLTAPAVDVPVVYGVFSKLDNTHYVRIEKGFIDPKVDAATLAADADNFNYDDVTVTIERGTDVVELERVDANELGLQREEGFFTTAPNYIYRLNNFGFSRPDVVKLVIDRGQGEDLITATTPIIDDFEIKTPNPNPLQTGELREIDIRPGRSFNVVIGAVDEAKIFDVFVDFVYEEIAPSGESEVKKVTWVIAKSDFTPTRSSSAILFEIDGREFFNLLNNNIEEKPGFTRKFRKLSYEVVAGGEALKNYARLTQANTGITSSQEVPIFTESINVEGDGVGIGIFSSKFSATIDSMPISPETYSEILNNELTRNLGFE